MSNFSSRPMSLRAIEAAARRQERDAKKRLRELERQAKEQAKLTLLEQGRLEVAQYENRLEILLSVHKECGEPCDWSATFATLCPPRPRNLFHHEAAARQLQAVAFDLSQKDRADLALKNARASDEREHKDAVVSYESERAEWQQLRLIAKRILAGDFQAYSDALQAFQPLAEITELGSSLRFTARSRALVECELKVNGVETIPSVVKALTTAGKLSDKPMPKSRFHEIYQDYVCGCMLRVAREAFAFLPIETLLITASADLFDSTTGTTGERPVVSAAIRRSVVATLDFDRLDPSDAIDSFEHRGDFKATRKSGAFLPIVPLTPLDIAQDATPATNVAELLAQVRQLRKELEEECDELGIQSTPKDSR